MNKDGDRAYSSYISLAAPFKLAGLDWTAEIGATPWANDFYNVSADPECSGSDGFAVCDISLGASKEIKITDGESAHRRGLFRIRTEFLTGSAENADTITNSDITTK